MEILAHRVVWSLAVVGALLWYRGGWQWLGPAFRDQRTRRTFTATALLITLNWFVYIWSVNAGYVVEASLGYFINPLVNVMLGVVFLKERLRLWQGVAVLLALGGVLYLALGYQTIPWIALTLAGTFALYGLLRKTAPLGALEGLTLETVVLFVPALAYLVYRQWDGAAAFGNTGTTTTLLLAGAGVATALPLLLFTAGARRIPLSSLGLLQYIAPTLQFLLGVFVWGELLTPTRLIGFCLIWLALLAYTVEGVWERKASKKEPASFAAK